MNDAPVYDLLRQASINTDNQVMAFYDSSWQDFYDTGRSTGAYIIFYQGGTIEHGTYVPGPVYQSSSESEYNVSCTAVMDLSNFRMSIHEFFNKDPNIAPEEDPMIILDINYAVCMSNNGKDTKHTRHISRIIHLVRNGEKCKIHNIEWCEGGMQLSDIAT